jgi:predicted kinase
MRVSSGRITFAKNRFPLFRVMRVSSGRITFAKNRFPLFRVML